MVHRDIKPANLMLSHQKDRALIKLLDFGLSKAASEQNASELGIGMAMDSYDLGEHLTCTGDMLGTPDFIAPEQIVNSQEADIRADIYSLGCTLYYLLSGQAPFPHLSLGEVLKAHRSLDARPLEEVRTEVPAGLSMVVAKMMAKDPMSRFQEPAEVAEALAPFFKKKSAGAASIATPEATEIAPGATAPNPPHRTPPASTLEGLIDLSDSDSGRTRLLDRRSGTVSPERSERAQEASKIALENLRRLGPRTWPVVAGVLVLGIVAGWMILTPKTRKDTPQQQIGSRHQLPEQERPCAAALVAAAPKPARAAAAKDPRFGAPVPIACWTFETDSRDQIGATHGTLFGGASIHDGRLYLDGKTGYMKTERLSQDVREKTLEAWVYLSNLSHRIGMKLVVGDGRQIVFHGDTQILWANCWPTDCCLAQIEVTQAAYQSVTNGNPSRIGGSPFLPVDSVAWDQAVAYCRKLTEVERKRAGCRPGTSTVYPRRRSGNTPVAPALTTTSVCRNR